MSISFTQASTCDLLRRRSSTSRKLHVRIYVDLNEGVVTAPAEFTEAEVAEPLIRAAQVIEMLLIRDHSRMKFDTPNDYDDTSEMQWRVMPTSHPEEYEDFIASVKPGRTDAGDARTVEADPDAADSPTS